MVNQALSEHPFRHCANTSISVVRVEPDGRGVVERFNDHAHLAEGAHTVVSKDLAA